MSNLIKNYYMSNIGFILLLIASMGDIIIPFLIAPFCKHYNHFTMVMSSLGNQKYVTHYLYSAWLIFAGILFIIGGLKLYTIYVDVSTVWATCLLVAIVVYAIGGCILSGIFPVGETKEMITMPEKIHGYGSVIGFFLLLFVPLIIGILSIQSKEIGVGIISIICFVLAIIFFVLFVMADKENFSQTIISYEGLWQRLTLFCMYIPIVIISYNNITN
ncbi:MAG: DUF998 domain-containing protein [Coprobacillaceae bacterium]